MNSFAKIPVTVLVQTKNEQVGIGACLDSLSEFDEVVVVDSNSSDKTVEIAKSRGARVVNFLWDSQYPKKKQWQLDHVETRNEWILFLDADESPTPRLVADIRRALPEMKATTFAAYELQLDYVFAGRTLRHGHRVSKRALANRLKIRFPVIDDLGAPGMGELEGHYQPEASGRVRRLGGRLRHDDQDPVRTWFERHNRYSDWEAYLRVNKSSRSAVANERSKQGRVFDAVPFKPLVFFFYGYVLRGGFLDGRAGLDYALALAMYYWQIELKTRERRRVMKA